jgi:hypothetical protein
VTGGDELGEVSSDRYPTSIAANGIRRRGEIQEETGWEIGRGHIVLMINETAELDAREGPLLQPS